jgi:hypothetical protein
MFPLAIQDREIISSRSIIFPAVGTCTTTPKMAIEAGINRNH